MSRKRSSGKICRHFNHKNRELTAADHPLIRIVDACFESSLTAVQFAKKHGSRLHIFHLSTEKELSLFTNMIPLAEKRITAEVCVHHLHFSSDDYARLGNQIKCNPAIKAPENRDALWKALLDDRLDLIATDHAPHTLAEKGFFQERKRTALNHSRAMRVLICRPMPVFPWYSIRLLLMLYYVKQGKISLEKLVEKMSHAVAVCFQIRERGFIREGYFADLVMVDLNRNSDVHARNISV